MAIKVANNQSLTAITALPSGVSGGAMNLLETQTASSSSTISFTSNIDNSYKEYIFKFYNIHPATDNADFDFNVSIDSGSNYNVAKTTTHVLVYHNEAGSATSLGYDSGEDLANGTGFQNLGDNVGNDNDQCLSGYLHLFDPSNTTFVKHFISRTNLVTFHDYCVSGIVAGYVNSTSAVDAVRFQMSTGNIDSGVIKLYGIS